VLGNDPSCNPAIPEAPVGFARALSRLAGLEMGIREESDPICYENYAFNESNAEGDLFFGTTIIYQGKVGSVIPPDTRSFPP
jgi:hypothetical protein